MAVVLSAAPVFAQAEAELPDQDRIEQRREERRDEWEGWRREGRDGVHFRMLRNYYLSADAIASEPIVVIGGNATIDGRADNDVVVVGGTLRLGPKAVVNGDVVTVGGEAVIDPGATVRGKVDTAVVVWPNLDFGFGWPIARWGGWWPFAAVSATVFRLSLVFVISLLLTVVAPRWIRSTGIEASSVVSSGLLGAIVEILFVPALLAVVIGLIISIVGIPLLGAIPFALALAALAWTGGFAAAAVSLGARLRGSTVARSSSLVADLVIGFVAITALTILAHVLSFGPGWLTPFGWISGAAGIAVEYVAWTIGLGAAISARFVKSPSMPPPVPATSTF